MTEPTAEIQQIIFNWVIGAFGVLGGTVLASIWNAVKDLQSMDRILAEKVAAIDVLVAGQYVKRDELTHLTKAMFDKLDRIEDKLDRKVDKSPVNGGHQ